MKMYIDITYFSAYKASTYRPPEKAHFPPNTCFTPRIQIGPMGLLPRSKERVNSRMALYLSYHISSVLFLQFYNAEFIGTRYFNASTWTETETCDDEDG